jgi:hypothetical protein
VARLVGGTIPVFDQLLTFAMNTTHHHHRSSD